MKKLGVEQNFQQLTRKISKTSKYYLQSTSTEAADVNPKVFWRSSLHSLHSRRYGGNGIYNTGERALQNKTCIKYPCKFYNLKLENLQVFFYV